MAGRAEADPAHAKSADRSRGRRGPPRRRALPARSSRTSRRNGERRRGRSVAASRRAARRTSRLPRGAAREVEEEALLARVAAVRCAAASGRLREARELARAPRRRGAGRAVPRGGKTARRGRGRRRRRRGGRARRRGEEGDAVALEPPLPDGSLLEGLGRSGRSSARGDDRAGSTASSVVEDARRRRELPARASSAGRSAATAGEGARPTRATRPERCREAGSEEVDDGAEGGEVEPGGGASRRERRPSDSGGLFGGCAREAGVGDALPEVVQSFVGAELDEGPRDAGAGAGERTRASPSRTSTSARSVRPRSRRPRSRGGRGRRARSAFGRSLPPAGRKNGIRRASARRRAPAPAAPGRGRGRRSGGAGRRRRRPGGSRGRSRAPRTSSDGATTTAGSGPAGLGAASAPTPRSSEKRAARTSGMPFVPRAIGRRPPRRRGRRRRRAAPAATAARSASRTPPRS